MHLGGFAICGYENKSQNDEHLTKGTRYIDDVHVGVLRPFLLLLQVFIMTHLQKLDKYIMEEVNGTQLKTRRGSPYDNRPSPWNTVEKLTVVVFVVDMLK